MTSERSKLSAFVGQAWHVVEPSTTFVHGWHLDAIAEHLEAVTDGYIRNLVINMPPRHMKSLMVSVLWPVWMWTFRPETRWLYASYALSLSIRDTLKARRIIQSPWFQAQYGAVFRLTSDQNTKLRYDNDHTGYRIATSVGGAATGEGGDTIVADDPHNVQQSESEAVREAALIWWDETMSTRLNNPKTGAKVIVMQRLHEADLSGHVLAQGGYDHLCLPAEYEPRVQISSIGWADPRTTEDELLWPERMGPTEITSAKVVLGPYGYAGQMQQQPMPRGGGMFKRDWWQRYTVLPPLMMAAQFVDSAFKEGVGNDPSVCATWGTDGLGNYYLIDLWRERVTYPKLMQALHEQQQKHRMLSIVLPLVIEDKASGQSAIQTLGQPMAQMHGPPLPALPVMAFPSPDNQLERDIARLGKQARAEGITPIVASGHCFLPMHALWVEEFIAEHEKFPNGIHDDQVDTTSMALTRLANSQPYTPAVGGERAPLRMAR